MSISFPQGDLIDKLEGILDDHRVITQKARDIVVENYNLKMEVSVLRGLLAGLLTDGGNSSS
jgi:hypothetical protein